MNRTVTNRLCGAFLVTAVALGVVIGCSRSDGRPKTYPVTGVVTLNGTPVEGATVVFVPKTPAQPGAQGPQAATATTDTSGRYALGTFAKGDGAIPGEYLVRVFKYPTPPPPTGSASSEEEYVPPEESGQAAAAPAPKNLLPEKYANENTSGLSFTVEPKSNTFDIQLTQ
ncbi:MAG TPA: carboxypeptidase-like regulatory domain-containing protein [Thermogutta sp.]|nr:carboxypeptidase-like regulatory domain-containing protein [Thermogutta sp.]